MADRTTFEYTLHDYLEIKASLNEDKLGGLKKFLSRQPLCELELFPLEGFSVSGNLILLQSGTPKSFKHLVFLNPVNGAVHFSALSARD